MDRKHERLKKPYVNGSSYHIKNIRSTVSLRLYFFLQSLFVSWQQKGQIYHLLTGFESNFLSTYSVSDVKEKKFGLQSQHFNPTVCHIPHTEFISYLKNIRQNNAIPLTVSNMERKNQVFKV